MWRFAGITPNRQLFGRLLDIASHTSRTGTLVTVDAKYIFDYFWTEPITDRPDLSDIQDGVYVVDVDSERIGIAIVWQGRYSFLVRSEDGQTRAVLDLSPTRCRPLARLYEKRFSDIRSIMLNTTKQGDAPESENGDVGEQEAADDTSPERGKGNVLQASPGQRPLRQRRRRNA